MSNQLPGRVVQFWSRWTFLNPELQLQSHGRRKRPCHRQDFHSQGPKTTQRTLVLLDGNKQKQCQHVEPNDDFSI